MCLNYVNEIMYCKWNKINEFLYSHFVVFRRSICHSDSVHIKCCYANQKNHIFRNILIREYIFYNTSCFTNMSSCIATKKPAELPFRSKIFTSNSTRACFMASTSKIIFINSFTGFDNLLMLPGAMELWSVSSSYDRYRINNNK